MFIQGTIKKKFKSDPELNNQLCKQIDHYLELDKCHRSIANYDNVRGIFFQVPGSKPLTLQAIEGEKQLDAEDLCQFFNRLSTITTNITTTRTSSSETTFVKRSYIEKQYRFELATCLLYQKDFDHKFRINRTTIQLIQPYYELDQFLVFIEQNLSLLKILENHYLTNNQDALITRDLFLERMQKDFL
ncbi:unnamed protein product [Rotaria socialis]|uniref:Uncharacterized protein n=1 Tax=Rotaria socialis TaxID=392032 RepID=A0A820ZHD8_9BILA|nr:unnamed protein product [Rotaria socialis]CAF4557397.1 unnamed protein product [Rotaria socialis]CAF4897597.1 unnamed protein product [Rotaria socialis]